jgi:hypothetical protein
MKSTTCPHLVLRLRVSGPIPLLPLICLHGVDRDNCTFSVVAAVTTATTTIIIIIIIIYLLQLGFHPVAVVLTLVHTIQMDI